MATEIVNLTYEAVTKAIEEVLEQYPNHPHQQAFAHPEMKQELIVYVLNQTNNEFKVAEGNAETSEDVNTEVSQKLSQNSEEINSAIRQGIDAIVQEKSEWIEQHIPPQQKPE